MLQTSEKQFYHDEHPICQISEKLKSAANIRKAAFPGQTSDMSDIRKIKRCCIHAKISFTRATHPICQTSKKNQKVLQTSEKQFYHDEHPICQISEKPKGAAYMRKSALPGQHIRYVKHPKKNQKVLETSEKQFYHDEQRICQISGKLKSAANIRKAAFPGQTSDMSDIRKTKRCCIHAKISFTMANIRYAKYPKNQKVLQTSEKQFYHDEHPICQISEKLKSAANIRKAAFPGQTSDMSDIRKTKRCCIHAKISFTRATHPICQTSKKKQKVQQTSEKQLFQGKHPICQTSEKPKSAAYMRKPALPGRTSDISDIRKTKKCCIHAKTSFTRATHPMCQISEKPKSAANLRKPALPGQTSDMSNIRKTKKCCKPAKTSFTRANIRYVKHLKNQKRLQTSENQLYHGEHPICQISEKPKSAANIRKADLPWRTSDMPNIRKTKKCCKHPKSSFSRANIRYVRHPKNQKVLHTCENQLYQGNTCDMSNIQKKNKKCCKHPKSSFSMANIRCVKYPKN